MSLRIYNTLNHAKEDFQPIEPSHVRMYVCGPTVYDHSHIGHARSVVVFDVVARYLQAKGFQVTYVRNFTDVDDKIINRANDLGMAPEALAEKFILEFHRDMDALNVRRPTKEPRATQYIGQMVGFIEKLTQKGMAYAVDGDVFFAVDHFQAYGKLSGRNLEEMEAGARVQVDTRKRNPHDFALWKSAKPGEPAWESPWGQGRPGWHIECSAMSSELLGETFDIHGGGKDLIFPHHENEIAQSEGASGKPFARFWMHNGFVNINHEKMSKSLGNFLMIKDVLKTHHPEAVRLFLLSNHYRSPIDFNTKVMDDANSGLDKIYTLLERLENEAGSHAPESRSNGQSEFMSRFFQAMDDDFNTAKGIGILFDMVRALNRSLDQADGKLSESLRKDLARGRAELSEMGGVLGILSQSPAEYFASRKDMGLTRQELDPAAIDELVAQRTAARKNKDFAAADGIRDQLVEMGVILKDRPDGTVWKIE
jgi:cysteinyl-tRNA synthetase